LARERAPEHPLRPRARNRRGVTIIAREAAAHLGFPFADAAVAVQGTEAFGFELSGTTARELISIVHLRSGEDNPKLRNTAIDAARRIVQPCIARATDAAIEVGRGESAKLYCLVRVLCEDSPREVRGVIAIITKCRNQAEADFRLAKLRAMY